MVKISIYGPAAVGGGVCNRRYTDLPEDEEEKKSELERVRRLADRLEGDIPEEEAVDLLEEAVEESERFMKKLEESG